MGRKSTLLTRHPWRVLGVLAALLVAVGSAVGSGALFTTQTVNPNNTFSSGILHVTASPSGAILTASNMVPGDTATGTATISNDGTVDGSNWTLAQAQTAETQGTDPGNPSSHGLLSSKLTLKVTDTTTSQVVYNGPISGLTSAAITGGIAHGTSHTFSFLVTFPPATSGNDNAYEGGSLTESYTWSATAGS
jgi:hypothetical protein